MMRLSIALLVMLGLLTGCAAVIERKMTTDVHNVRGMQQITEHFADNQVRYCNQEGCAHFLDLSGGMPLEGFSWRANLSLRDGDRDIDLSEEGRFDFPPATDADKPLVIIFPGYGTSSVSGAAPLGMHFRALGYPVLVNSGPTEHPPFEFGLHGISALVEYIAREFPERPLITAGVSMGVLGVTEFNRMQSESGHDVSGTILVAPMLDFESAANAMFIGMRGDRWLMRGIPQRSFDTALQRVMSKTPVERDELRLENRIRYIPENSLILLSNNDSIAPSQEILALFKPLSEEAFSDYEGVQRQMLEAQYMARHGLTIQLYDRYPHVIMAMSTEEQRTRISQWLGEPVDHEAIGRTLENTDEIGEGVN
ncbi:serine aminopeptidase domain-containing protein [Aliidiomarina indica]|uniref:serine aminopeptidase domain-containing protein n=1 Tax=Aliidiomarina indica TaxID=2749147 RepID=UPI00188FDF8F|nr:alpha/beta hydrolase [Aliidiomarina indica]